MLPEALNSLRPTSPEPSRRFSVAPMMDRHYWRKNLF